MPDVRAAARARAQLANQKDAIAFLIDAGATMLQPHGIPPSEDDDPAQDRSMRDVDLAIQLAGATHRGKCVALARARGARRACSCACTERQAALGALTRARRA